MAKNDKKIEEQAEQIMSPELEMIKAQIAKMIEDAKAEAEAIINNAKEQAKAVISQVKQMLPGDEEIEELEKSINS